MGQQPNPSSDLVQYVVAGLFAAFGSIVTLIGVVYSQSRQALSSKQSTDSQKEQKQKELVLQGEKQKSDIEDNYYKNLVDLAEKVQKLLTEGYENRIKVIEGQAKEYNEQLVACQDTVNKLIEKVEEERMESRKKISKLEKRLIEGYNVIMKLLALLKQGNITIPEEIQTEIANLRPSDTQQL